MVNRTLSKVSLPLVVGVSLVLLAGMVSRVDAKPRIALTEIVDGDDDGEDLDDLVDAVADALDSDELSVIYPKVVTRAVDRLGYDEDLTEKQARKVANELEADALVVARFERDGKHKVLRFTLYIGGEKARGFKVTFNNAKSERFQTMLRDKIVQRVERAERAERADDDEDEDDDRKRKKKKGKRVAASDDDDDDDDDADEDADDEDREARTDDEDDAEIEAAVRRVSPHAANRIAVRLDVGVSVQNRTLTFTQRADFPEGPKPYKNAPVPGARFETELYPFAFSNPNSFAAGFGIAAEYDKTLSLTLRTSAEPTVPVAATQQHWSVGGRYRIPFGSKPTSPTLTVGAGFGRRSFTTDRSGLQMPGSLDIPDTSYKVIDPGLAVRVPLATTVALTFGGRAMLVLDAGPIQDPQSYGQAKVFGVQGQAGIDIVLANRFAIRLVGEFTQLGFAFTGTGAMANARDQDSTTKDVGGAADRSLGGAVTLGVLY